MVYFVLLALVIMGGCMYVVIVMLDVPGMMEERLGVLEPLPEHLNTWVADRESDAGKAASARGEQRETRLFRDSAGGALGRERLLEQTRFRDLQSGEIKSVEPDRRYRRRRIRK